ncbi:MAG: undecaprenyl-diphosphate phosphatase [Alicyclobacillaceae bacterium]|jgi:undecaprenyl-diphosphatase|uniref:undecaprenyl-diphosphate phosphatase n=1 Tax=Alicyclobacillus sp. SP_1 TaxID=2942475 RepID=UPI0021571B88|nr:undecaprenyl-diphosphate phosphatase [Alicyclobacillus sp. SP_1]MCY0888191.1 undecaprenyl-diphosphate phosphatase [Alicyclobacillaceae bacterium]MCY0896453.1 undecaprenyl-diphosphate phosphatase [Alicyclobacillaceae bacterium]
MTALQAILLGIVQGATEFLPVSSSGHLVIMAHIWKLGAVASGTLFILLLHVGTLAAVIYAMRRELLWWYRHPKSRLTWVVALALLPTAVVGALFEEWFEDLFHSGATVGLEFVITGCILWWMDSQSHGKKDEDTLSVRDSLWIGALQGAAILPALSRSGLTIGGGLWRGMDREAAARFSFLLAIPAILGGVLVKLDDLLEDPLKTAHLPWGAMGLGAIAAAISGYIGVRITFRLLKHSRMRYFAIYTWMIAAFVLADQLFVHQWFPPLFHG